MTSNYKKCIEAYYTDNIIENFDNKVSHNLSNIPIYYSSNSFWYI